MSPPLSVEVSGKTTKDETAVRRNPKNVNELTTKPLDGVETVTDVLNYAARVHGTKEAHGTRDVVQIHEEEKEVKKTVDGKEVTQKRKWQYFELGGYKYTNYVQVKEAANELALGLVELGVQRGQIFNIYAATSANWQLMQHACSSVCIIFATAYESLGESGLQHALNEPECVGVFTNADLFPTLAKVIPNTPSVKFIVHDGEPSASLIDKIKSSRSDIRILTLEELRSIGKGASEESKADVASRLPTKDDTACIMYTSGSTGAPKGVVLSHLNLISALGSIYIVIKKHLTTKDQYLSFLPLSHILAYVVDLAIYFLGITVGYGRPRTLVDSSVRNCKGDLKEFRPTIMIGVPAIWETIRKGIAGKVNSSGTLTQSIFSAGLQIKKMDIGPLNSLVDATVLKLVKENTGGRLRLALSGGAALSVETQEYLTLALVAVLQGYGLTESCGMCAIMPPESFQYGVAGSPVPSIEIKLLSVPEANYLATNKLPQGEILIRGPSVTKGYFKRPDLNEDRSVFTEDGWFRTGDVGQFNEDGSLTIIDRVKNLVKLSGGEYIALERLESIYKSCPFVSNLCVHGDSNAKQPIAIIIPHEANLRGALQSSKPDLAKASLHDICADPDVEKQVLDACNAVGKKAAFKGMELLQAVILTSEDWTPENGLLTAAHKIQRKKISDAFAKEIKDAYKKAQGDS